MGERLQCLFDSYLGNKNSGSGREGFKEEEVEEGKKGSCWEGLKREGRRKRKKRKKRRRRRRRRNTGKEMNINHEIIGMGE